MFQPPYSLRYIHASLSTSLISFLQLPPRTIFFVLLVRSHSFYSPFYCLSEKEFVASIRDYLGIWKDLCISRIFEIFEIVVRKSFKTILSIAPVSLVPCLFFYFSSSIFLQFCFVPPSMRPELYTRVFSYAVNSVSLTLVLHDFLLLFVRLLLFANMPLNFSLLTRSKFSHESGFLRPTTGSSHHYTFWVRVIVYMFPFSGTLLFVVKFPSFLSLRILSLFFVPFSRVYESSFFAWLVILYLCFDHVHTMTKILYPSHFILSLHLNVCT